MDTWSARVVCVLLATILAGCGITPVQYASTPDKRCSAIRHRIAIDPPTRLDPGMALPAGEISLVEERDPIAKAIVASYADAATKRQKSTGTESGGDEPVSPSMLFLSGGSQDGAFGAGLLSAWAQERSHVHKKPGLPRFRVVTGISTGALQSTFAFLDDTDETVRRYSIAREEELLKPLVPGRFKDGGLWGKLRAGRAIATKGTLGELEPLRAQLRGLIDAERLRRIAQEAGAGRWLLVAAVEMDTGDAYAFDLTEAATRYVAGDEAMRDCYIEALLASSSVPMAARPVFIDGHMYIDGGARFGVISDEIAAIHEAAARTLSPKDARNLFVVVNGTLEVGPQCHLEDSDGRTCTAETGPGGAPVHPKWRFDGLAFRSLSILINQSYRSSVYWTTQQARARGFTPWFARIDDGALAAHVASVGLPPEPSESRPCSDWSRIDRELENPLEFHPRFMRCEIDYGRSRPEAKEWAALE